MFGDAPRLRTAGALERNMFRDGQYLEVIKASDDCLATAVVTVQEKTVEIKKQKVITNKWLQVEDWAALYRILERAVLRNGPRSNGSHREGQGCEWRKSTRQLEVTYTFEYPECASDATSLPTIKVHVSPARRSVKREKINEISKISRSKVKTRDDTTKPTKEDKSCDQVSTKTNRADTKNDRLKRTSEKPTQTSPKKIETEQDSKRKKKRKYDLFDDLKSAPLEEYIPDAPKAKKSCTDLKYVPSQKSALESMPLAMNEYTPTLCSSKCVPQDVNYVPNSIEKLEATYETYEPCATTTIPNDILKEYVPNSKGVKPSVEEYEPDFKSSSKLMKFDDSYVPSTVRQSVSNSRRMSDKSAKLKRIEAHRKGTLSKKKIDPFS